MKSFKKKEVKNKNLKYVTNVHKIILLINCFFDFPALFGVFGLAMFHTKHYYQTYECKSFDILPKKLCEARIVEILYAVPLAWMGVLLCLLACALWLVFARALRVIMAKTML